MVAERHVVAWWIAGSFAVLATLITFVQIAYHLQWTTHKYIRRYVIRIIFMVPIYSLESFLGLRFKDQAMYWALLRECYEALVIYSFYQLLVTWLGGEDKCALRAADKEQKKHMMPFCCLRPWSMTNGAENPSELYSEFLFYTQTGTLQYCIVKPLLGLIAFICALNNVYDDGKFEMDRGYVYVTFFANLSQIWAMYCLIMFYMVFKQDLAPIRPIPKFLVVKAVVFFTFWQGVLLALLKKIGLLTATETYTEDEIVSSLQDFIVCLEMTIAAIAHHFAFSHKDFLDGSCTSPPTRAPVLRAVFEVVNVTDVYVNEVRKVTKKAIKKQRPAAPGAGGQVSPTAALGPAPSQPFAALTQPLTTDERSPDDVTVIVTDPASLAQPAAAAPQSQSQSPIQSPTQAHSLHVHQTRVLVASDAVDAAGHHHPQRMALTYTTLSEDADADVDVDVDEGPIPDPDVAERQVSDSTQSTSGDHLLASHAHAHAHAHATTTSSDVNPQVHGHGQPQIAWAAQE